METKVCTTCKNEKEFRLKKDKRYNKYYLYSCCKECEKIYFSSERAKELKKKTDKRYRENHKTEINNKMKIRAHKMTIEEKEKRKSEE